MEVNEYLPTGVRVLSSIEPGKKEPDIIKEALNINLNIDIELVYTLQDNNDTENLYRYLLVKQCNALNQILPGLFEKIEDYTEILLPSNLLGEGSVIRRLVDDIPEEDFKDQVEIIGWMYQYYISEKKDEVFKGLKKNIKITKENIPAATQLFTPDWIVKYMVENSLGRLWVEGHPNEELKSKWKYYLEEAQQEPEVQKQLEEIRAKSRDIRPEDIKVLDPAMGSGHILVYAFDVLYDIYKSEGYSERDIPRLILENNLYGLDIDDRAAQLAYFAVMMKARSKSRRIFREKINVNVCAIQESNGFPREAIDYLVNQAETEIEKQKLREDVEYLINVFHDAKEYGSILEVNPVDFDAIERRLEEIRNGGTQDLFEFQYRNIILEKIPALVKQARIMSQKYDVVVTNPPYMGNRGMNGKISQYVSNNYPDSKLDLFAVFIEKSIKYTRNYVALITQQSWMFLSSYERLRNKILNNRIINLVHLGSKAFEEIKGEKVKTASFVISKINNDDAKPKFIKLTKYNNHIQKEKEFFNIDNHYSNLKQSDFRQIQGCPIAYWAHKKVVDIFDKVKPLKSFCSITNGMFTCNNDHFLKLWFEVNVMDTKFHHKHDENMNDYKWFPYNKGGDFRKWYGNHSFVVNFKNNGKEVREYRKKRGQSYSLPGEKYYFNKSISWTFVSSSNFGVRFYPNGFIFDIAGSSIFPNNDDDIYYITAFLCTNIATLFMQIQNPTLNFQASDVANLPLKRGTILSESTVKLLCEENVNISKIDWDSFETSWNFTRHPLLVHKNNVMTIEQAFNNWSIFTENQFNQLKANEEELNRIFIEIYGLQDELTPEVEDKDVTIRKADRVRDIKSFISYAVGCMFGRYSIDAEGLIYAGGDFKDRWKYENGQWKVRRIVKDDEGKIVEDTWVDATFVPDIDNVIPITDDEYFEDDIVSRFIEFLKVTFGEDTLEENLDYIADTLGRKSSETARQAIRRYFLKDFYKDHVQVYQKKPIYWLFDSGKQDGFKALIYMHRYDEFTVARVRTDYLHKLQKSYEAEIKRLDIIIDSNVSQREKTNARKKKEQILKQMEECLQYDQIIAHVANQRIKIDLDDGVSVNYSKFQGIEVPQGEGRKPLKADLLAKI